jgi:beta-ureidopropionase / N-carbamoyl-L-amino-acid hydrolase
MPTSNIRIDGERLWSTLIETAQFGATELGGLKRLTLTDEDKQVRDWFRSACTEAGCSIAIDEIGSIFARRAGADASAAPILFGSHLDTQPTGGKFDGILGVLAGLEVMRTLNAFGYTTRHPLEVVDWTNEEGSRFAPAMVASGVFAGAFTRDYAWSRTDPAGVRLSDALARIGYRGDTPCAGRRPAAYFELHIEQGPILEAARDTIGIVTGIQGIKWIDITVTGQASHSGTTPMPVRRDALVAAARIVELARSLAERHAPHARATVGRFEVAPNSRNVVPGSVSLTVDIRHPDAAQLATLHATLLDEARRLVAPLDIAFDTVNDSPPIAFDPICIAAVREAAERLRLPAREMVSGAGHDAAYLARVCPAGMIFVPCEGGLSHNEIENATIADVAAGAQVLLEAILAADQQLP